jgi:SAM-dependent methyltransferase
MAAYKDYFSGHASDYATFRPHYPPALFEWLARQCGDHDCACDCATGNGQAAIALTPHFRTVIATDASAAQLTEAPSHPQVTYQVTLAETTPLPSASVDLVTVAQAVHWFNLDRFYREVQRVLKLGGVIALWCYGVPTFQDEALDSLMMEFYGQTLETYWAPERQLVEAGYRTLAFPFEEISVPPFVMRVDWNLAALMGYIYTWSATQAYQSATQRNPLVAIFPAWEAAWGNGDCRSLSWPLHLRVGRVS